MYSRVQNRIDIAKKFKDGFNEFRNSNRFKIAFKLKDGSDELRSSKNGRSL